MRMKRKRNRNAVTMSKDSSTAAKQINAMAGHRTMIGNQESIQNLNRAPTVRRVLKGHEGKVYSMHWAGDGVHLVSASQDGKLIVWNAFTNTKVQTIPLRSSWVMTCAFEQSRGNMIASGGLDNLCSIYILSQPSVVRASRELAAHDGYLSCCRFVDDTSILTSSGDSTCILWDIERGETKQHFIEHGGDALSLSISPTNQNVFVSGSCDATAKVWDARLGKCVMTFEGHESDINSVSFFSNGNAFCTGSDDSSCKLFDIRAGAELNHFANDQILCGVTSIDNSISGKYLFAGYDDHMVLAWDTTDVSETRQPVWELRGHSNRVSCIGVNRTGEALCTGSWDTLLRVWA